MPPHTSYHCPSLCSSLLLPCLACLSVLCVRPCLCHSLCPVLLPMPLFMFLPVSPTDVHACTPVYAPTCALACTHAHTLLVPYLFSACAIPYIMLNCLSPMHFPIPCLFPSSVPACASTYALSVFTYVCPCLRHYLHRCLCCCVCPCLRLCLCPCLCPFLCLCTLSMLLYMTCPVPLFKILSVLCLYSCLCPYLCLGLCPCICPC